VACAGHVHDTSPCQATSEEDCGCTAVQAPALSLREGASNPSTDSSTGALQALLLAMEAQFGPPPPLDTAGGGGGGGVALCPLANLAAPLPQRTPPRHVPRDTSKTRPRRVQQVLPREDAAAAAAAGAVNARLGRPPDSSGSDGALRRVATRRLPPGPTSSLMAMRSSSIPVHRSIRCVATRDLPAGALVIAADYREEAEEAEARAGEEEDSSRCGDASERVHDVPEAWL